MKRRLVSSLLVITGVGILTACGNQDGTIGDTIVSSSEKQATSEDDTSEESSEDNTTEDAVKEINIIHTESGVDGQFDWDSLMAENPEVYAWLFVPDTDIDCPLVCSIESEDFYETHDATGAENPEGAVYTQFYNVQDMCDFNTVIYGKTDEKGNKGNFSELYQFTDADFFDKHNTFYIYLPEGMLEYQIIAAYERTNDNVLADYDTTTESGCQEFINKEYLNKSMSGNYREGWEGINAYHFLVSLTTRLGDNADKQFVVLGILISDQTGTINREVIAE